MKVSEQQRTDWVKNPVTIALRELCWGKMQEIDSEPVSDLLVFGNPQLTQEKLLKNTWRRLGCVTAIELLNGDWSEMEIDDEE